MNLKFTSAIVASLILHGFALFLLLFSLEKESENGGVNLKEGTKFESIMILANAPIGELKEVSIDQKKAQQSKKKTKKQIKPKDIKKSNALASADSKQKARVKAADKISHNVNEKSQKAQEQKESVSSSANANQDSKAKNQTLSAPIQSNEKNTQTAVSGNAKKQIRSYQAMLMAHLIKHQRYPKNSLRDGEEGKVSVRVSIDSSGNVIASHIKKSCPYASLNDEALDLFHRASPLPKPPSEVIGSKTQLTFSLPINFNIRDYLRRK